MDVTAPAQLVEVGPDNVDETSFFCLQSRPDSAGYRRKRAWLDQRFSEGLRIRMLGRREKRRWNGPRGFIEYIPGRHAWRGVDAGDYLVIHCLWVVGKSQGHGGARTLLEQCFEDARGRLRRGRHGHGRERVRHRSGLLRTLRLRGRRVV